LMFAPASAILRATCAMVQVFGHRSPRFRVRAPRPGEITRALVDVNAPRRGGEPGSADRHRLPDLRVNPTFSVNAATTRPRTMRDACCHVGSRSAGGSAEPSRIALLRTRCRAASLVTASRPYARSCPVESAPRRAVPTRRAPGT
jgi:hypothetical protein